MLTALSASHTGALCAQTPPSARPIAAYRRRHAAAHRGDLLTLREQLIALEERTRRTELDTRNGHGRTPLPAATFARQREAVRLLAMFGAELPTL
ncbi:MAG: hypothetical protein NZ533_08495 [Casimicrobiaceae bacterium]|nr:hypothetical protein [Casimicrobiaceae bacterium]